jgi:ketosteroid isomerase-like protein
MKSAHAIRFAGVAMLILACLALPLIQPQAAGAKQFKPPADVQKFLDDFGAAAEGKDVDAILSFYSDKFLLNGRGKDSLRQVWQRAMKASPKRTFKVVLKKFEQKGNIGYVAGSILTNGHTMSLRSNMIIKENGAWRWYGNQQGGEKAAAKLPKLGLAFGDPAWDGKKIPQSQQCRRFGGKGATPPLVVSNIPAGANAIILAYSDRSYPPMDKGGHGIMGYKIAPGSKEVKIPPVPGHSYDLPKGFFVVSEHLAPSYDKAGAYMPPCSGGRGNEYYLDIKAVRLAKPGDKTGKVLATGHLELGKY